MATGSLADSAVSASDNEDVHVVPLNDLLPHTEIGADCMCDPRIEIVGGRLLIVHNSYDGREEKE